jgi:hypothetical protein
MIDHAAQHLPCHPRDARETLPSQGSLAFQILLVWLETFSDRNLSFRISMCQIVEAMTKFTSPTAETFGARRRGMR